MPVVKTAGKAGGRPPAHMREAVNAIFYVVKTGCGWRSLPHDLPWWQTVYGCFNRWGRDGGREAMKSFLVEKTRIKAGRKALPTAGSPDWQSIKTTACGGRHRGYDAGKQIKGRKRFILAGSQGLLLAVWICAASVSDENGGQVPAALPAPLLCPPGALQPDETGVGGREIPGRRSEALCRKALGLVLAGGAAD